jgi:hypothetical protein
MRTSRRLNSVLLRPISRPQRVTIWLAGSSVRLEI